MRAVIYIVEPSQLCYDRYPPLKWRGIAYNCLRHRKALSERGYMGLGNCNQLAEYFFWHYPASFSYDSRGWPFRQ